MQLIISITIFIASIAGVVLFGMPQYEKIQEYKIKKDSYNEVLDSARTLTQKRKELMERKAGIDEGKLALLDKMLPSSPQNVALILELDALARKYDLSLQNVKIEDTQKKTDTNPTVTVGISADTGTLNINFSLIGPYTNFTDFVRAAEKNLRLIDFQRIEFTAQEDKEQYQYNITIRTYWLK